MSPLLETMIAAAREAGAGLKEDFARKRDLTIRNKGGADFVSQADERAEETCRRILSTFAPDYAFLGEEGGRRGDANAKRVWMVDPLDGTTNFLWGIPLFGVSIGLAEGDDVVAGVIFHPMSGELFYAEKGQGAFLDGAPIHVSTRSALAESVVGIGIPFKGKPGHALFHAEFTRLTEITAGLRRSGAACIDLAWAACGRYDAYLERVINAWDMAAGACIAAEAGATVTDADGGPLKLQGGSICVASPNLSVPLLAEVRAARESLDA